jgi:hypothetical protein
MVVHRLSFIRAAALVTAVIGASVALAAQTQFQFYVSVTDSAGKPVTELTASDVRMTENGKPNEILKVEPYHLPVDLTIAVDNGPGSPDGLSHYRSGLAGLVKALPDEVPVTLITTSPQPRTIVQKTTDREKIFRGINGFAPESESPRFTDTIVEFSKRYEKELKDKKNVIDSIPVLVMISTTSNEAASYEVPEIQKAMRFLQARRTKVYLTMWSQRSSVSDLSQINDNRQAMLGIPLVKGTGGRYEPLAISNRLATLLPEFGEDIGKLHSRHYNQFRVTVQRQSGLNGPLQNPQVEVTKEGMSGAVSLDGFLP